MKKFLLIFSLIFLTVYIYAGNIKADFESFIETNRFFLSSDKQYMCNQKLISYENNEVKEEQEVCSIYNGNNQIIKIKDKKQDVYFLSTNAGYWIYNKKLQNPIKVTGKYEVDEMQVQDLTRIDYTRDYEIVEESDNFLLLQRTNSKLSYYFIEFRTDGDSYELVFCDKNKKQLKRIVYQKNSIDGADCLSMTVYPLVFDTEKYKSYIIYKITEIQVPTALFKSDKISSLIKYFKDK